jgi:hypothetical protein
MTWLRSNKLMQELSCLDAFVTQPKGLQAKLFHALLWTSKPMFEQIPGTPQVSRPTQLQ